VYSYLPTIYQTVNEVCQILSDGGNVLIHCAAGLHRTGMVANIILRYMGYSHEQSMEKICEARKKTFELCGEHRFAVADSFVKICGTFINQTPFEKIQLIAEENASRPLAGGRQRKAKVKSIVPNSTKQQNEPEENEEVEPNNDQEDEDDVNKEDNE